MHPDSNPEVPMPLARRQLHLLYHELRSAAAAYSYVTSTALFEQHVNVYARLIATRASIAPAITFDDGHVSNLTLAAPILESRSLTAHFFIAVGWTAARTGYMDWSQLRALVDSGHTIGAHGWSHMLLTHCTAPELDLELRRARLVLEDKLGVAITTISLPGGRGNRRVLAACSAAGYTHVYTSEPQAEPVPPGRTIGRFNIRGDMSAEWLAQLFTPSSPQLARIRRMHRVKSTAKRLLGDRLYARVWGILNRQEAEVDPEAVSDPVKTDTASPREPFA